MNNASNIIDDLKSKGHKSTKVRRALVEVLLKTNSPLSVTDLLQSLSKKDLKPNKTTIYREIEFLRTQEILEEVEFNDGKKRYEISQEHHHHLICINCQKTVDVPMEK